MCNSTGLSARARMFRCCIVEISASIKRYENFNGCYANVYVNLVFWNVQLIKCMGNGLFLTLQALFTNNHTIYLRQFISATYIKLYVAYTLWWCAISFFITNCSLQHLDSRQQYNLINKILLPVLIPSHFSQNKLPYRRYMYEYMNYF